MFMLTVHVWMVALPTTPITWYFDYQYQILAVDS